MKTQTEERISAGLPDPRETARSINRQAALASTSDQLDRYGTQIAARMNSEGARDWSDSEIERCLSGCVSGPKLIALAKQMRAEGMTGPVADRNGPYAPRSSRIAGAGSLERTKPDNAGNSSGYG